MNAIAWLLLAASVVLIVIAVGASQIGNWHSREAAYWREIAWCVRLNPSLDAKYRPILDWAQANRPTLRERVGTWESPEKRRLRSGADA